jgi:indole-3-glycerol phosphate synthase
MSDFLDILARVAKGTIDSGYYNKKITATKTPKVSLRQAVLDCKANPVIAEIKAASPSAGVIKENLEPRAVASAMAKGGATGLSVLTEPNYFNGALETLAAARAAVPLPILMKDIVLSPKQIHAASKLGANALLLIKALFDRGYGEKTLGEMIDAAHRSGLEVLLETHTQTEFEQALATEADLIGINNRNLASLSVNLNVTKNILAKTTPADKVVVSESGIKTPVDIRLLRGCGASAFLIGSSIMVTDNIEAKVREFVNA